MIKHFITIFLFLFIIAKISASEITMTRVDSLLANKDIQEQENILDSLLMRYGAINPTIGLKLSKRYADLVEGSSDTYKRGHSKFYLGLSYEMIGEFDKSLEYLFEARNILTNTEYKKNLALVYNEIGLVYYEQQNEELKLNALEYFNKFLELSLIIDDKMEIAGGYSNIGMLYSSLNKLDSSLKYHNKALKIRLEINDKRSIGISYANIGDLEFKLGNYESAISDYKKAESLYKEIGYTYGLYEVYYQMANLYFEKQEFDKAGKYAFLCLDICHKINSKQAYRKIYSFLSDFYKKTNDIDSAYSYLELSAAYKDSITNESIRNKLVQMQTMYELDKKDQSIELLKRENENQLLKEGAMETRQYILLASTGAIIIIFLLVMNSFFIKRRKQKQIFLYEKKLLKTEMEKKELRKKELESELEYKSRQMTTHTLNMMQKNKALKEMTNDIADISKKVDTNIKQDLKRLKFQLNQSLKADKDWDEFRLYFEQVNQTFFGKLREVSSNISPSEERLSTLIKLKMNIKETASVLNISPSSVKMARYRLRQKLNLPQDVNLYDFIGGIG